MVHDEQLVTNQKAKVGQERRDYVYTSVQLKIKKLDINLCV